MARQNGISVEDMLKLDVMKSCKLIAGFRGARNTISRVNIMADPDILEWTTEGEFLLTTAYSFKGDNIEEQMNLIKECASKGLAGIGIKISPYIDSMVAEVLNLANDLSLPIIDIHCSIPLADIMMEAFKEIFNKQASLLGRIEKVHEQLMDTMLAGDGLEDLVKIVEENVNNPVILNLNFSDRIIKCLNSVEETVHMELMKEVEKFYGANNSKNRLKQLDESKVLINGKYVKRMIMPIMLRDTIYGHLFSWSTDMPLGGFDLSIIESASTTMALLILQELSIKEVEIRYRSEFFEDLISLDIKTKKKALERAAYFNLPVDSNYLIEVMSFNFKAREAKDPSIEYTQDYINTVVTTIEELMKHLNLEGVVATRMRGIQILIGYSDEAKMKDSIEDFNNRLISLVEKKYKDIDVRIGVGRAYKSLENVDRSFQEALRTIRIGRGIMDKSIITFDELGIFKILSEDSLADELEDFYNSTLKPLADYDDKKSTELVKTLDIFFKNNGNLTRISEQLFAHYNTILYRITRINEITKMNLDDPNDRLNLEIAIKIKELLKK